VVITVGGKSENKFRVRLQVVLEEKEAKWFQLFSIDPILYSEDIYR